MGTAKKSAVDFHSVANHLALAMFANGRNGLDCALEAVEGMSCASCDQVETLVILIPTHFTGCHFELLSGVAVEFSDASLIARDVSSFE
jgi:hypothetical protein